VDGTASLSHTFRTLVLTPQEGRIFPPSWIFKALPPVSPPPPGKVLIRFGGGRSPSRRLFFADFSRRGVLLLQGVPTTPLFLLFFGERLLFSIGTEPRGAGRNPPQRIAGTTRRGLISPSTDDPSAFSERTPCPGIISCHDAPFFFGLLFFCGAR